MPNIQKYSGKRAALNILNSEEELPNIWAMKNMEQARLEAQLREGSGKGAARATRRAGFVPAIIYGHKIESTAVQLPERNST